jgi:uncharacterized protein (DUF1684 family)
VIDELALLDWRRRVHELYEEVRAHAEPDGAWRHWRAVRDDLFRTHPQSPLAPEARARFTGVDYFDYDPAFRVLALVEPVEPKSLDIAGSAGSLVRFRRFAVARFDLAGTAHALELYWLDAYGGGVFLPFADATSGSETYGAGRYGFDTVKGADLDCDNDRLVVDFNFAYNPSCSYDPSWACPLAPAANRLSVAIRAGERYSGSSSSASELMQ